MNKISLRRAFVAVAVLAGAAALVSTPVFAQPVCGGVASLMNKSLAQEGLGVLGDNIVSIPAVSPINNNPGSPTANGFIDLCRRFGLTGTTSSIQQNNANLGATTTFTCDQSAAPPFAVGQAVIIRPTVAASGRIPGVECSQAYTAFIEGLGALGDNYFPVPVTFAGVNGEDLCTQMGLANGSIVIRNDAAAGAQPTHVCGTVPQFSLQIGEGVLIRPTSTKTGSVLIF